MIGWLGAVAFISRYLPNQGARTLYAVAPRELLFYGAKLLAYGGNRA